MSDPGLPPEVRRSVELLVQQTFGSTTRVSDVRVANRHEDYFALIVTLRRPARTISVKLAGPRAPYPYPFDRTAALHRLVAERTSIPMPDILAVDTSYRRWPWRVLVKTYIPGQEWVVVRQALRGDELADAYRQIGRAAAELHAITFLAFGSITPEGVAAPGSDYLAVLAARVREMIPSARLAEKALSLLEAKAELFAGVRQARLCHEDLHQHNILFEQVGGRWRLATILDFDKGWAGHHEIDLARLELWRGMVGEGFWAGYNSLLSPDPGYPERRPIYQFIWCLEFAEQTPEHLADTRQVCEALGLPPIDDFS